MIKYRCRVVSLRQMLCQIQVQMSQSEADVMSDTSTDGSA